MFKLKGPSGNHAMGVILEVLRGATLVGIEMPTPATREVTVDGTTHHEGEDFLLRKVKAHKEYGKLFSLVEDNSVVTTSKLELVFPTVIQAQQFKDWLQRQTLLDGHTSISGRFNQGSTITLTLTESQ